MHSQVNIQEKYIVLADLTTDQHDFFERYFNVKKEFLCKKKNLSTDVGQTARCTLVFLIQPHKINFYKMLCRFKCSILHANVYFHTDRNIEYQVRNFFLSMFESG